MGLVYDQKPTQIVDEILHSFPKIWPQLLSIPTEEMKKQNLNWTNVSATNFGKYLSHTLANLALWSSWDIKKDMTKGEDEPRTKKKGHEADLQHSPKKP